MKKLRRNAARIPRTYVRQGRPKVRVPERSECLGFIAVFWCFFSSFYADCFDVGFVLLLFRWTDLLFVFFAVRTVLIFLLFCFIYTADCLIFFFCLV